MLIENKKLEKWKPIKGYENYEISTRGRIKTLKTKRISYGSLTANGYMKFSLCKKGVIPKTYLVHRLVADHFIPNPKKKPEVNHFGDKTDNRTSMLEWVTKSENMQHAFSNNLVVPHSKRVNVFDPETRKMINSYDFARDAIIDFPCYNKYINTGKIYKGYILEYDKKTENKSKDLDDEIWVKLKNSIFPEVSIFVKYKVSNHGRVKNNLNKIMKIGYVSGRASICLHNKDGAYYFSIHRLVIMAFNIPNHDNKKTVDHVDSNPLNNHLSNLRWATIKEQAKNENTSKKRSKPNILSRKTITVSDSEGNIEIFYGLYNVAEKLNISVQTINKYAKLGTKYKGYKFVISNSHEQKEISKEDEKIVIKNLKTKRDHNVPISVTNSKGATKLYHGLFKTAKKLSISPKTIVKYANSGEIYNGYKFSFD
jgi:hypothetical protein